jgi:hypothetical protein
MLHRISFNLKIYKNQNIEMNFNTLQSKNHIIILKIIYSASLNLMIQHQDKIIIDFHNHLKDKINI